MHTILITIILICLIVAVCLVLTLVNNKAVRKRRSTLLKRFKKLANENNISVPEPELLKNAVFGTDPLRQQLLILTGTADTGYDSALIRLDKLKDCSKKKTYLHLDRAEKKENEKHLEKITLRFEFHDGEHPAELVFYEYRYNSLYEMPELEQRADHWERLLEKNDLPKRA